MSKPKYPRAEVFMGQLGIAESRTTFHGLSARAAADLINGREVTIDQLSNTIAKLKLADTKKNILLDEKQREIDRLQAELHEWHKEHLESAIEQIES